MDILLTSPPAVQSYINLCYRYVELGEVAGYLRACGHSVTLLDGLVMEDDEWREAFEQRLHRAEVLILHHSGENISGVLAAADFGKRIRPNMKSATYGIISSFSAEPFKQSVLDGIVIDGDWEAILAEWLSFLAESGRKPLPSGVLVQSGGKWEGKSGAKRVPAERWALPALDLLPLEGYKQKYCGAATIAGFKGSFELSLSVSRGCPYNCWFCPSGRVDGKEERRRPVWQVLDFLRDAVPRFGFDQFAPFSACFTLDRDWVLEFCAELIAKGPAIPWRCVTTLQDLDESLLRTMAAAGCQRIGIGVETMNPKLLSQMSKEIDLDKLAETIRECRSLGITPLCFLLDGLPGQAPGEAQRDAKTLTSMGAKVRISKLVNYRAAARYHGAYLGSLLAREVKFMQSLDGR